MLLEDASRAFPYRRFDEAFKVNLVGQGTDESLRRSVARALDRERYGNGGSHAVLEDAIRDFAEECIPHVLMFGEAAYELVLWDPDDQGSWRAFDLALIHPYWRRLGRHMHFAASMDGGPGQVHRLAADSVVLFRLEPRRRRREVDATVSVLAKASSISTAATTLTMTDKHHDFRTHTAAEEALLARATRSIGWTGRGLFTKNALEPYRAIRDLRFASFHAELRSMIVTGINEALHLAGKRLGFTAAIDIEGVSTDAQIRDAIGLIRSGVGVDLAINELVRAND